jgi:hypothetical protein
MDAVLGWNLLLSLPVILAIARLAGRLLGGATPASRTERPQKPVEQLRHGGAVR